EISSPTEAVRPRWKNQIVATATAISALTLLALFGYLVWPGRRSGEELPKPPKSNAVAPGKVFLPGPLAQVTSSREVPPATPPEGRPAPDLTVLAQVSPVADIPGGIGAPQAPRPATPAILPVGNGMAKDQQTVDLRGPTPRLGFKFREISRIECR